MEETKLEAPENKKSLKPMVLVVGLVILGILASLFIFNSKKNTQNVNEAPISGQSEPTVAPSGPTKEFTVDGSNFAFDPKTITVNKGDTVKITFKDDDGRHNLVIDGYDVSTNIIAGGSEDTITFLADKTGSFAYYCSVANHRDLGMTGTLIVKP
ncbi:MAG TPA: plastocyanin/azurin family copper-binding protein [Patescibacteria group bacterium]|nr:plastocyanin/azurin family copper-binding protein [Patescibacteria group bacterium]